MLCFFSKLAAVDLLMAAGQQVHVTRVHHLHPAEVAVSTCDFFSFGMDFSNESKVEAWNFLEVAQHRPGEFGNFQL